MVGEFVRVRRRLNGEDIVRFGLYKGYHPEGIHITLQTGSDRCECIGYDDLLSVQVRDILDVIQIVNTFHAALDTF